LRLALGYLGATMAIEIIYGFLAVVIPAVISLTLGGWQNRKTKADAAKIYHDMLVDETKAREALAERVRKLGDKLDEQETEIQDLRGWAEKLVAQVIEHGGEPVPFTRRRKSQI
jgi:hypothetical protein